MSERSLALLPSEKQRLLKKAPIRNSSIPSLIEHDQVMQPRHGLVTGVLRLLSAYTLRQGTKLEGQDNLEQAWELVENGETVFVVSNHLSDSDHAIKRFVMEKNGFKGFADKTQYMGGLNMVERWYIRMVVGAENMLLIPTPSDMDMVHRGIKSGEFTPDELVQLFDLKENYIKLSFEAQRKIRELARTSGSVLGFYPEGGRSYSGMVDQEHMSILTNTWYQAFPDAYIVPISVEGGEYILPPQKKPVTLLRRINAVVSVDEPFSVEEMKTKSTKLKSFTDRQQFMADYPFARVVKMLDPKLVNPNVRPYYLQVAAS